MRDLATRQYFIRSEVGNAKIPYEKLSKKHLHGIIRLLYQSYEVAKRRTSSVLTWHEPNVNMYLVALMNQFIARDPFLDSYINAVSVKPKQLSYDATTIQFRPDIVLALEIDSKRFDFQIEAAIIDRHSRKYIGQYCASAMDSNISGMSNWHLSEAMMIAYIRDGSNLCANLNRYFTSGNPPKQNKYSVKSLAIPYDEIEGDVSCSVHDRKFKHIVEPFNRAGPIDLWHVGLS